MHKKKEEGKKERREWKSCLSLSLSLSLPRRHGLHLSVCVCVVITTSAILNSSPVGTSNYLGGVTFDLNVSQHRLSKEKKKEKKGKRPKKKYFLLKSGGS